MSGISNACTCKWCVSACHNQSGVFRPEEISPAAKLLGMSVEEFFHDHLIVDYFIDSHDEDGSNVKATFFLRPGIEDQPTGCEAPFYPKGTCVLLTEDQRCSIHEAKPSECRHCHHTIENEEAQAHHKAVIDAWRGAEHQQMVRTLLGREPVVPRPSRSDKMKLMFNKFESLF